MRQFSCFGSSVSIRSSDKASNIQGCIFLHSQGKSQFCSKRVEYRENLDSEFNVLKSDKNSGNERHTCVFWCVLEICKIQR